MNNIPEKLRALAATARIANVPSVAGNVFLGAALAKWTGNPADHEHIQTICLLIVSGICLYLGGNFSNDWADRDWDAAHRPERALPRRLFTSRTYLSTASVFGLLGLCTAAAVSLQCLTIALVIGVSILIYTWAHKRAAWSVIPIGLCRALLPALGFSGFAVSNEFQSGVAMCALGLFCHIVGLSLSARRESMKTAPTGPLCYARFLFLAAALLMFLASWQAMGCPLSASAAGALPYILWIALCLTVFRKPVPVHVSNLLAGIPLVDWIVLLPLAISSTGTNPFTIACMAVPPLAFLSGKALQGLAPAT